MIDVLFNYFLGLSNKANKNGVTLTGSVEDICKKKKAQDDTEGPEDNSTSTNSVPMCDAETWFVTQGVSVECKQFVDLLEDGNPGGDFCGCLEKLGSHKERLQCDISDTVPGLTGTAWNLVKALCDSVGGMKSYKEMKNHRITDLESKGLLSEYSVLTSSFRMNVNFTHNTNSTHQMKSIFKSVIEETLQTSKTLSSAAVSVPTFDISTNGTPWIMLIT